MITFLIFVIGFLLILGAIYAFSSRIEQPPIPYDLRQAEANLKARTQSERS